MDFRDPHMQAQMERHTCSTCHWCRDAHCMFNPPTVQLVMAQTLHGTQPQPVSVHPPVRPNHFCSKHSSFRVMHAVVDV